VPAAKIGPTTGYRWIFTDESLDEFLREEIKRQTAERRGVKLSAPTQVPTAFTRSVRRKAVTPPPLR